MATHRDTSAHQATRIDDIHGRFDPWLAGIIVAIATLGVIMVASSSIAVGEDMSVGRYYFLTRHFMFLALGIGLAAAVMRTELKTIEKYDRFVLLMCAGLLMLVFVPGLGVSVNGAHRWINLGISNFQVVEAVKVIYIVWLSSYLVRFRDEVNATWGAMLKPIGVAVVLVALLLLQPDFGSSMLLLGVTAGMLVLGGGHLKRMLVPILLLLPAVVLVAIIEPYRLRRITSFMDPWEDQLGAGYQLSNALMAVGRGELTGVGLGASVQKLSYLPEAHTDFIFSVLAEELGFVGVCLVVALFSALVGRALWIGLKCVEMRRHFAGYCAFGVALMIGMQSLVSIGVNLGLLPTKGLTLPLVSSGGSSVMMTCVALGLLLRVSYELDRAQRQVARLRGETASPAPAPAPASTPTTQPPLPVAPAPAPVRGTSRLRQRVEPRFGAGSPA
ncbi:putative lipid II flippase FtsW [Lysobacteraceae bacterium NML93-0792]|nr:putative lipid II flippase FtsW [Xanthomonadaceae bacterium NML93-0792]PBS14812.1 putative lipid II flippase FtsW [Xanthomonadaceae bacterium NML93-0793]PBS18764.1 putative lipid II flippase FtsW [Xanthomonadaceae bacterium NML93-0831]